MKIAIGNDHVALKMKLQIKEYLQENEIGSYRCRNPLF